jgi:hypothetical protein
MSPFCGHSKIRVAIVKCTFSAVTEQLISKVRNLLFSFFLGKKGKNFENSKFGTLLISSIFTAENVHFTIATRILLCPPNGDQKNYYVRHGGQGQRAEPRKKLKKYGKLKNSLLLQVH